MMQDPPGDRERIRRNAEKMRAKGASSTEIERYLQHEGLTPADGSSPNSFGGSWEDGPVKESGLSKVMAQIPTLGFGDEIAAGVKAGVDALGGAPLPEAYNARVSQERHDIESYTKEHPVRAVAGSLAAGGLLPAPAVKGLASFLKQAAGFGAAAGVGGAEGGVMDRAEGGAKGAAAGLATVGILGGGAKAAGGVGTALLDRTVRPRAAISAGGKRLPISTTKERGQERILRAFADDQLTVDDAVSRAKAAPAGAPVTMLDVGGENVLGLGRALQSVPGRAKQDLAETLIERGRDQGTRVAESLRLTSGVERRNIPSSIDDLAAQRSEEAAPLYAAFADREVDAPELAQYLQLPAFRKAYERAQNLGKYEGDPLPALDELLGPDGALTRPLTMRAADRIKRGLDDVLDVGRRSPLDAGGLGGEEVAAIRGSKNKFVGLLDQAVPEYRAARSAFAGKSALIEAMDTGRNFFKQPQDELENTLARLGDSEREAFRLGAMAAVREKMDASRDGWDVVSRLFGSPKSRQQMRALFDDTPSFDAFQEAMEAEAQMHRTKSTVLGGSPTARIQAEVSDLGGDAVGLMTDAATGNAPGLLRRGLQAGQSRLVEGNTRALAEDMSPMLTAGIKNRADLLRVLDELKRLQEAPRVTDRLNPALIAELRALSVGAGATAGRQ